MSNLSELLLTDIEQQINKVVFFFMINGGFPKNWSVNTYNDYLANRKRTMRIYAVAFYGADEESGYRQKLTEMIASQFPNICFKIYNTKLVCLSFDEEPNQRALCTDLKQIVSDVTGTECVCYSSEYFTDTAKLVDTYQTMRRELDELLLEKGRNRDNQIINLFALENVLFDQIMDGDIEGLNTSLREIYQAAEDANRIYIPNDEDLFNSSKYYFSYLWRRIPRVIYERIGKRKTIKAGVIMDLEMANLNSPDEIIDLVQNYIIQLSDELHLTNQGSFHKIIENVKKYIDDNFASDVSLKFVAEQVGLSSYYLSKLFKKEEGMNFKDYVIMVRMEKSMQLINEGKLNINEIACAVGYTNANYFSQAFHKYYGTPPKACQTRGIRPGK